MHRFQAQRIERINGSGTAVLLYTAAGGSEQAKSKSTILLTDFMEIAYMESIDPSSCVLGESFMWVAAAVKVILTQVLDSAHQRARTNGRLAPNRGS